MTFAALAPDALDRLAQLTPKERACLRLVGRRQSSKAIAAELGIAKTSVDTYCNRARAKLEVMDRYEAARLLLAAEGGAPAPVAAPAPPARRARNPRLALGLAVGFALVVALATLLSGLRALEVMKPLPSAPASAQH